MKLRNNLWLLLVTVLLAGCVALLYQTRDPETVAKAKHAAAALVDDRLLRTARQMAATADNTEEQDAAREALHLADHAVDQAFATALREALAPSAAAVSAEVRRLTAHIDGLRAQIAANQKKAAQLAKEAETSESASDELDVTKAELSLEQDELDDAVEDRAREGGDRHSIIERALEQHESDQKAAVAFPRIVDVSTAGTLYEQVRLWLALGGKQRVLDEARQQALEQAAQLSAAHNALEKQIAGGAPAGEDKAATLARLRRLADQRKTLAEFDKRIQDCQQLAAVYQNWSGVAAVRQRRVLHMLLGSLAMMLGILLAVAIIDRFIRHAFQQTDRKKLHQIRLIATVAVQVSAVLAILLIIFGAPTQLSTIIGLATAGLTVVMKDYIVAFFGWFTLMGRNGIRVGDWVEIEGVSGEVIEIGVFKTVLLEMGNWSAKGQPTGRQVAFSNSFAMENHYFNFSTASQWLWDRVEIAIPVGGDPYRIAEQIRETVEEETREDAAGAAQDWERVASKYGSSSFSAKPSVQLRPSPLGLEVLVKYITRAPRRDQVKSRLYQAIVDLLHKKK
jgi:small-conductance mechanosensitive channel